MTESRKNQAPPKANRKHGYHEAARSKHGAGTDAAGATAGRTPYREEFEPNYGPDLDEALDGTESGHEF